eukprot:Rmarinus@m.25642
MSDLHSTQDDIVSEDDGSTGFVRKDPFSLLLYAKPSGQSLMSAENESLDFASSMLNSAANRLRLVSSTSMTLMSEAERTAVLEASSTLKEDIADFIGRLKDPKKGQGARAGGVHTHATKKSRTRPAVRTAGIASARHASSDEAPVMPPVSPQNLASEAEHPSTSAAPSDSTPRKKTKTTPRPARRRLAPWNVDNDKPATESEPEVQTSDGEGAPVSDGSLPPLTRRPAENFQQEMSGLRGERHTAVVRTLRQRVIEAEKGRQEALSKGDLRRTHERMKRAEARGLEKTKRILLLQGMIRTLEAEVSSRDKKLADMHNELLAAHDAKSASEGAVLLMSNTNAPSVSHLEHQLRASESDLETARKQLERKDAHVRHLELTVGKIEKELSTRMEEEGETQKNMRELEKKLAALDVKERSARTRANTLEKDLSSKSEELESVLKENDSLRTDMRKLRRALQALEEKLEKTKEKAQAQSTRAGMLETERRIHDKEVQKLKDALSSADELEAACRKKDVELARCRQKLKALEVKEDQWQKETEEAAKARHEAEATVASATKQTSSMRNRMRHLKEQQEFFQNQLQVSQKELEESERLCTQLQGKLQSIEADVLDARQKLEKSEKSFENTRKRLEFQCKRYSKELEEKETRLVNAEAIATDAQERAAALEENENQLRTELSVVTAQRDELQVQLESSLEEHDINLRIQEDETVKRLREEWEEVVRSRDQLLVEKERQVEELTVEHQQQLDSMEQAHVEAAEKWKEATDVEKQRIQEELEEARRAAVEQLQVEHAMLIEKLQQDVYNAQDEAGETIKEMMECHAEEACRMKDDFEAEVSEMITAHICEVAYLQGTIVDIEGFWGEELAHVRADREERVRRIAADAEAACLAAKEEAAKAVQRIGEDLLTLAAGGGLDGGCEQVQPTSEGKDLNFRAWMKRTLESLQQFVNGFAAQREGLTKEVEAAYSEALRVIREETQLDLKRLTQQRNEAVKALEEERSSHGSKAQREKEIALKQQAKKHAAELKRLQEEKDSLRARFVREQDKLRDTLVAEKTAAIEAEVKNMQDSINKARQVSEGVLAEWAEEREKLLASFEEERQQLRRDAAQAKDTLRERMEAEAKTREAAVTVRLESEMKTLSEEAAVQLAELEQRKDRHLEDLFRRRDEVVSALVEEERQAMFREIKHLQRVFAEREAQFERSLAEAREMGQLAVREVTERLQVRVQTLEDARARLTEELQVEREGSADEMLKKRAEALIALQQEKDRDLHELRMEKDGLIEDLQGAVAGLRAQVQDCKRHIAAMEVEVKDDTVQGVLARVIDAAFAECLARELAAEARDRPALEKGLQEAIGRIGDLEASLKQSSTDLAAQREQCQQYCDAAEKQESALETANTSVQALTTVVEERDKQIAALSDAYATLQSEAAAQREALDKKAKEVENLTNLLGASEKDLLQWTEELQESREHISALRKNCTLLEQELEDAYCSLATCATQRCVLEALGSTEAGDVERTLERVSNVVEEERNNRNKEIEALVGDQMERQRIAQKAMDMKESDYLETIDGMASTIGGLVAEVSATSVEHADLTYASEAAVEACGKIIKDVQSECTEYLQSVGPQFLGLELDSDVPPGRTHALLLQSMIRTVELMGNVIKRGCTHWLSSGKEADKIMAQIQQLMSERDHFKGKIEGWYEKEQEFEGKLYRVGCEVATLRDRLAAMEAEREQARQAHEEALQAKAAQQEAALGAQAEVHSVELNKLRLRYDREIAQLERRLETTVRLERRLQTARQRIKSLHGVIDDLKAHIRAMAALPVVDALLETPDDPAYAVAKEARANAADRSTKKGLRRVVSAPNLTCHQSLRFADGEFSHGVILTKDPYEDEKAASEPEPDVSLPHIRPALDQDRPAVAQHVTDEEVDAMADFLGLAGEDGHLRWLAVEAMALPLPAGFTVHEDDEGSPYYYNEATDETSWNHPLVPSVQELCRRLKEKDRTIEHTYRTVAELALLQDSASERQTILDALYRDLYKLVAERCEMLHTHYQGISELAGEDGRDFVMRYRPHMSGMVGTSSLDPADAAKLVTRAIRLIRKSARDDDPAKDGARYRPKGRAMTLAEGGPVDTSPRSSRRMDDSVRRVVREAVSCLYAALPPAASPATAAAIAHARKMAKESATSTVLPLDELARPQRMVGRRGTKLSRMLSGSPSDLGAPSSVMGFPGGSGGGGLLGHALSTSGRKRTVRPSVLMASSHAIDSTLHEETSGHGGVGAGSGVGVGVSMSSRRSSLGLGASASGVGVLGLSSSAVSKSGVGLPLPVASPASSPKGGASDVYHSSVESCAESGVANERHSLPIPSLPSLLPSFSLSKDSNTESPRGSARAALARLERLAATLPSVRPRDNNDKYVSVAGSGPGDASRAICGEVSTTDRDGKSKAGLQAVEILGSCEVGSMLIAGGGVVHGVKDGEELMRVQWYKSAAGAERDSLGWDSFSPIVGADTFAYTPTPDDTGCYIALRVWRLVPEAVQKSELHDIPTVQGVDPDVLAVVCGMRVVDATQVVTLTPVKENEELTRQIEHYREQGRVMFVVTRPAAAEGLEDTLHVLRVAYDSAAQAGQLEIHEVLNSYEVSANTLSSSVVSDEQAGHLRLVLSQSLSLHGVTISPVSTDAGLKRGSFHVTTGDGEERVVREFRTHVPGRADLVISAVRAFKAWCEEDL